MSLIPRSQDTSARLATTPWDGWYSETPLQQQRGTCPPDDTSLNDGDFEDATPSEITEYYEQYESTGGDKMTDEVDKPLHESLLMQAKWEGLYNGSPFAQAFSAACLPAPSIATCDDQYGGFSLDDDFDPSFSAALDLVKNGERWNVDKDTAMFIATTLKLGEEHAVLSHAGLDLIGFSDTRVHETLLTVDPDMELESIRSRHRVKLSSSGIQPWKSSADDHSELDCRKDMAGLPQKLIENIKSERLSVPRATAEYLLHLQRLDSPGLAEVVEIALANDRNVRHMTPPELALSPLTSPPGPLPTALEIEFTSSAEDLFAMEAVRVNEEIAQRDRLVDEGPRVDADNTLTSNTNCSTPQQISYTLPADHCMAQLKLETPLTPRNVAASSPHQNATASLLPSLQPLISHAGSDTLLDNSELAEAELEADISAFVLPGALNVAGALRDERLIEVDTTMRVPIPSIIDRKPLPPWEMYLAQRIGSESDLQAQNTLLRHFKKEVLGCEKPCGGIKKLAKHLNWTPFPTRLGKVTVDEDIDDDHSAAQYLTGLSIEEHIDVQDLVGHAERLRILQGSDSDDELELPVFCDKHVGDVEEESTQPPIQQQNFDQPPIKVKVDHTMVLPKRAAHGHKLDMHALSRKRRLQIGAAESEATNKSKHPADKRARTTDGPLTPSRPDEFFSRNGIAGFMHLQGRAYGIPTSRSNELGPQQQAPPAAMKASPAIVTGIGLLVEPMKILRPDLLRPERQMQVVVTSQVLVERTLTRQLELLLPQLQIVERELIKYQCRLNGVQAVTRSNPEADITVSPSVGIVITSLQKLKQQPLPGQAGFVGIRERTALVARRYGRLLVLISEGQKDAQARRHLDELDSEALNSFMADVAHWNTEIQVRYVPGGTQELAQWTATAISAHAEEVKAATRLLQEETVWERFLRTAGLNAFAAQVVLGMLKSPGSEGVGESDSSADEASFPMDAFGLAAFVIMSPKQRRRLFESRLGGTAALDTVAKAVNSSWLRGWS